MLKTFKALAWVICSARSSQDMFPGNEQLSANKQYGALKYDS